MRFLFTLTLIGLTCLVVSQAVANTARQSLMELTQSVREAEQKTAAIDKELQNLGDQQSKLQSLHLFRGAFHSFAPLVLTVWKAQNVEALSLLPDAV